MMRLNCQRVVLLLSPLFLLAVFMAYPVSDDWSYITTPNLYELTNGSNLLPRRNQWRVFDGALGYLLGRYPDCFPWLNHLIIAIGHVANTLLVCHIARKLDFNNTARSVATFVFYLSPAMTATVLNTDTMNQVYSQFWGLTALLAFLQTKGKCRYAVLAVAILLAVLSKENGIMWAIVIPLIIATFRKADRSAIVACLITGVATAALYLALRFTLSQHVLDTDSAYINENLTHRVRGFAMFLGYSFLPVDYVSLIHPPSRRLVVLVLTTILSLPLLLVLLKNALKLLTGNTATQSRTVVAGLVLAILLLALPHLLTIYTAIHAYAALSVVALLLGYMLQQEPRKNIVVWTFAAYLTAIILSTWHHWQRSVENGRIAQEMARSIVSQSHRPAKKVKVIMTEDHSPKYSSFCPQPADAFGWGISVKKETHFLWPENFEFDYVPAENNSGEISTLSREAFENGCEAVWIVDGQNTKVVEK